MIGSNPGDLLKYFLLHISYLGSGGTCGDTSGSRYCGQALNFVTMIAANIPICDCTAPFAVSTITDNVRDAKSDVQPNRGNL